MSDCPVPGRRTFRMMDGSGNLVEVTDAVGWKAQAEFWEHRAEQEHQVRHDLEDLIARLREALSDADALLADPAGNPLDAINLARERIRHV